MNKKFLSAILFGALLVTSTGTFVSCSDDYDDDIARIDQELTDIRSAITALQSKVGDGKYVTNVAKNGDGLTITWSDSSTSTIETIKGDNGADGKNGTVVTIVDGYWAFDGVKSEYPATPGDSSNGQDAHEIKIEDGYWSIWNSEKGAYEKTPYAVAPVSAAEVKGGWSITVKDPSGEQTIFLPTGSAMSYMDILNGSTSMNALYGINAKDVEYGPAKKTLKKGLYTTLDRDLQIVVNPQGTDASAYSFSLVNSANVNTELVFKDAVPFKGVLTTRATSENAVWVLPHDFVRYENIDDARTKNYLLFKANDGAKHALSLTATLGETSIKTPYDLGASLKKIGEVKVALNNLENCAVNTDYTPNVRYVSPSVDAGAVYDYWITLEQSAKNLKNAVLYGVEIDSEGHSFKYTSETGVNNNIEFVYNYILMDGTIVEGDKDAPHFIAYMQEEMANVHELPLERLYTPMDAKLIVENKKAANYNPELKNASEAGWYANGKQVFALNTESYSLSKILDEMTDVEKAVWNSAVEAGRVELELIGGEGENNEYWDNWAKGYNVRYEIADNAITFQFVVSEGYPLNFTLNNAYQLTFTVKDEDTNTPVASIVLPFEFTQPTLDIKRVNGEKALWTKSNDKLVEPDVLRIFGDLITKEDASYMYVPFYEAFTTAYAKQYSEFVANAPYYTLTQGVGDDAIMTHWGYEVLGSIYADLEDVPLTAIQYSGKAGEWNTYADLANHNPNGIPVIANYKFYGVYPATKEQVPNFTLRFASLLGDADPKKIKANKDEFTSNNVTREVVLTDADFTLVDALDDAFYLFNGVKADGNVDKRSDMNLRQGFEEGTEGFATSFTLATANIKAYYYKNGAKTSITPVVGTIGTTTDGETLTSGNAALYTNANTKTRTWVPGQISATDVIITDLPATEANKTAGYAAIPGGVMIQLPSSIGTTEPVTIEFELVDVFGMTKTLTVVVKAAK